MAKKIKLFIPLLLILLILAAVSGNSAVEIENYAIVTGLAVDRAEEGVALTVEIASSSSGKTQDPAAPLIFSAAGADFTRATLALEETLGKPVYWAHAEIALLSRAYCEAGIEEFLDWALRAHALRIALPLAVSEGEAGDLLQSAPEPFAVTAFALRSLLDRSVSRGTAPRSALWQIYNHFASPASCALLPLLAQAEDGSRLAGSALLKAGILTDTLSLSDTLFLSLACDSVPSAVLSAGDLAFSASPSQVSRTLTKQGVQIALTLRVSLEQGDPGDRDAAALLEKELTENLYALAEKAAALQTDLFGLSLTRREAGQEPEPNEYMPAAVRCTVILIDSGRVRGKEC